MSTPNASARTLLVLSGSVVLMPGGHRRAEGGHPWIYSNEVRMDTAAKALSPGALVTLRRANGSALGVGMFNPHSLLAARLLDRDSGCAIDRRFLGRRSIGKLRRQFPNQRAAGDLDHQVLAGVAIHALAHPGLANLGDEARGVILGDEIV